MPRPIRPDILQASKLEALLKTAMVLSSDIHLESLLMVIAEQVSHVLEAERSSVFLYDDAHDELRGVVVQGVTAEEIRFPANRGLAGFAAQSREMLNIPDAQDDRRFNGSYDARTGFHTDSVLCAPILSSKQKLIGVIQVLNKKFHDAFSQEDEVLLEAFSAHAAVAIERARLVEQHTEQQRLQESLHMAHEIQMSMLPQALPVSHTCYDLHVHFQPAQTVGGDLYDFFLIDTHRLGFAVGDVSDKGVPAALFANGTSTLLRLAAIEGLLPDRCFDNINRVQRNRKAMFVTLFYGLLDLQSGCVTYGNAGHPPPCIVRRDGSVFFAPRAENLPLCLLDSPTFQVKNLQLEPDDLLVLYTDGVLEAMNHAGDQFGQEGLRSALQGVSLLTPQEAVSSLIEEVHAFTENTLQHDDLTVLVLRYNAPGLDA